MNDLEVKVKGWPDLIESLFDDTWDQNIKRHRSPYAYRGMSCDWELKNSLSRNGPYYPNLEQKIAETLFVAINDPGQRPVLRRKPQNRNSRAKFSPCAQ